MRQNFTDLYLANIKLSEIDLEDKRFNMTFGEKLAPLICSIREVGIISPPVVKEAKRYIVVSGYKRIKACEKLDILDIKAFVTQADDKDCFFLNFYDNIATRTLNEIEKAESIKRLIKFGVSQKRTIKDFLPLMNLPPTPKTIEDYSDFLELEDKIKEGIVEGKISTTNSLRLLEFSAKERMEIFKLIVNLHLSENKQKEVITNLKEISRRENISVLNVLKEKKVINILQDNKLNILDKANRRRVFLGKRRMPILSFREEAFKKAVKDKDELKRIVENLKEFADHDKLNKLLNYL